MKTRIKIKLKDYFEENKNIEIGARFFYRGSNYILASVDKDKINLISAGGSRFHNPVKTIDKIFKTHIHKIIPKSFRDEFYILKEKEKDIEPKKLTRFEMMDI